MYRAVKLKPAHLNVTNFFVQCDQQKEGIVNTPAKMDEYCKENNFSAWYETSAKEDINIDDAAKSLVTQVNKS